MAKNQSTKPCKYCRSDIDKKAKICPVCKKKQSSAGKVVFILLMIFVFFPAMVGACTKGSDNSASRTTPKREIQVQEETKENSKAEATEAPKTEATKAETVQEEATEAPAAETVAEAPAPEPTEAPQQAPAEDPAPADNVSLSQKNALRAAKNYLSFMPFSHQGLVEQLEYEGFSHEDAVYAADNCGADWNAQAAKKAESYLEFMPFSRDGLIEQLVYDGFTQEQAESGAKSAGY